MSLRQNYRLEWAHGSAEVGLTAAMLSNVVFRMPRGDFMPFAQAPWDPADPQIASLPGHLRHLGAEFVCLPFGGGGAFNRAAPGWEPAVFSVADPCFHGAPADLDWTVQAHDLQRIVLTLDLPQPSPVRRLERVVAAVPEAPALQLGLTIHPRRDCRLPIGLHPILRLPEQPGMLEIQADFETGMTFPADGEAMGVLSPGQGFGRLDKVPGADGVLDLSRLPLPQPVEAVVQLFGIRGDVTAIFRDSGCGVRISWPTAILPSLQVWLSDRALRSAPWDGRYRGLGLEPIAALFDLGTAASAFRHPALPADTPNSLALKAGEPVEIDYRMTAFQI